MKRITMALLAAVLLVLAISCSGDGAVSYTDGASPVEVCFALTETDDRALYAAVNTETSYYTYTATPLFSLAQPAEIVGTRSTEYNYGATGSANIGYFTAGRWTFHVYAYNAAGFLIREGETTVYLRKTTSGIANTVAVTLTRSVSRKGNIHFRFVTNDVSASGSKIGISWSYNQGSFNSETYKTPVSHSDNVATYDFSLENMQSGTYTFKISLYDGTVRIGGTTMSTYILGSNPVTKTTDVTGHIYPAEHLSVSFSLDIPEPITGSVGNYSVIGAVNTATTFTWTTATGSPVTYVWYRDGAEVQRSSSRTYTWTPAAPGAYTITCVGLSASGLESGSAVCLLDVRGQRDTFSATWASPSGARTVSYSGTAKASSLVRVEVNDGYQTLYVGYLTLSQSGSAWVASVSAAGRTLSFSLSGGTLTMTPSSSMSGLNVVVEGRI